jgi:hypothetical protein
MREIRLSGLEGGVRHNPHPYPYRQVGNLRYGAPARHHFHIFPCL